jgi:hypothetical protein
MKRLVVFSLLIPVLVVFACGGGVDLIGDWATLGGQVLLQYGSPVEEVEVAVYFPDSFHEDKYMFEYTDKDGWYSHERGYFNVNDDTVITPSHPAYTFSPSSYTIYENSGDHLDLDFTAIPIG